MMRRSKLLAHSTMSWTTAIAILVLIAAADGTAAATEESSKSAGQIDSSRESGALVAAAKKGKARRKSAKPVVRITDADVRKASGSLTLPAGPASTNPKPDTVVLSKVELLDEKRRNAGRAREVVEKASLEVDALQRELARLEDDYYAENDATYRDDVLRKRFEQTRRHLDRARQNLHAARENLMKFDPPPVPPVAESAVEPHG